LQLQLANESYRPENQVNAIVNYGLVGFGFAFGFGPNTQVNLFSLLFMAETHIHVKGSIDFLKFRP